MIEKGFVVKSKEVKIRKVRLFMKKKLIMTLMASVVAISLCACGGKDQTEDAVNAAETATTQEATEEAEEQESEGKVSERADYVGFEDLVIADYVTIPEYASMTVQAEKPQVTDEDIESYINRNILSTYPVTDRAVENGDAVTIDYVGKKDDVAFDGGTAEGYVLNIGSGTFIEGFEEGLIGVMPGETVDLNLTFPENYGSEELAGADVVFTVTVHDIQESTDYASVTEEQLALMEIGYTSKDDIWTDAAEYVEESAESTYQSNIANAIVEKLMEESTFTSVPELLVEEEFQNYNTYMEALCTNYYGCDVETFVTTFYGITMDEYNTQMKQMCEDTIKQYLVMEAISRAEGIEVTEEVMNEVAAEEAVEYGYESADALIEEVGKTTYRMYILQDKVMTKLMDMVTVEVITPEEAATEETTTEEATTEAAQ